MDHYFDIRIKPCAKMRENVLLNRVYTRLHRALYDLNSKTIGVSFPEYQLTLGKIIRVHSQQNQLLKLQAMSWLDRLTDFCKVSEINPIPSPTKHRNIARVQSNMTAAKLRRLIKRGNIPEADINVYREKMFSNGLNQPYLELESNSNGQWHRRYIQFGRVLDQSITGDFDQFGLSKNATVPWF